MSVAEICFCVARVSASTLVAITDVDAQKESVALTVLMMTHAMWVCAGMHGWCQLIEQLANV
jgi:hypothetical protein